MSHFQSLLVRVSVCGAPYGVPLIEVSWLGECRLIIFTGLLSLTTIHVKHLVRGSSKHRRKLYVGDVASYVAQCQQYPYVSSFLEHIIIIDIYALQLIIFPSPPEPRQETLCVSSCSG